MSLSYSREELALLNYKELRKLCKQVGVKANKKHGELVDDLAEYFLSAENELKELEKEMLQYETTDLNTTFTYEDSKEEEKEKEQNDKPGDNKEENNVEANSDHDEVFEDNKEDCLLKATLMKEVERRAEEKLSKIPRFVADKVIIPNVATTQPVTPDIPKKTNSHGIKMDSIDKYLEKKKKRASEHLKYKDNFKENALPSKKLNQPSLLKKPGRKSVKVNIDPITDFNPKINSTPGPNQTRVSPRLAALKDTNRPKPNISSLKDAKSNLNVNSAEKSTDAAKKKSKRVTLSAFSVRRKSDVRNSAPRRSEVRKSLAGSSPFVTKVQTPTAKTPIKFDLKQSLKKALPYKPHTGKLKEVYFTQESVVSGVPRKPVNRVERKDDRKVSVKERTKNISTRDKRRNEATAKREKSRLVVLDKRRGIVG